MQSHFVRALQTDQIFGQNVEYYVELKRILNCLEFIELYSYYLTWFWESALFSVQIMHSTESKCFLGFQKYKDQIK